MLRPHDVDATIVYGQAVHMVYVASSTINSISTGA